MASDREHNSCIKLCLALSVIVVTQAANTWLKLIYGIVPAVSLLCLWLAGSGEEELILMEKLEQQQEIGFSFVEMEKRQKTASSLLKTWNVLQHAPRLLVSQ